MAQDETTAPAQPEPPTGADLEAAEKALEQNNSGQTTREL